jgi:hypothetical protein
MNTVTVFQFSFYDINNDELRKSLRWGTKEAIEKVGGIVIPNSEKKVSHSVISTDSDLEGFTIRNYNPNPRAGFQQQVI